jgi:hypothetical protein
MVRENNRKNKVCRLFWTGGYISKSRKRMRQIDVKIEENLKSFFPKMSEILR